MPSRAELRAKLGEVRKLAASATARRSTGVFLVEGATLFSEALSAGLRVREVFLEAERAADRENQLAAEAAERGVTLWEIKEGSLQRAGLSNTPQPLLGVFERPPAGLRSGLREDARFVLVAAGVSDPGNTGALLRCAEGSGADAVIFAGDCADPFGPKAVRASAGSLFRLPVYFQLDHQIALEEFDTLPLRCVGSAAGRGLPYESADLSRPLALVVGNESHGIPPAWESRVDDWVHILLDGSAESLNVSAAAAVLCFEVRRRQQAASRAFEGGAGEERRENPVDATKASCLASNPCFAGNS